MIMFSGLNVLQKYYYVHQIQGIHSQSLYLKLDGQPYCTILNRLQESILHLVSYF